MKITKTDRKLALNKQTLKILKIKSGVKAGNTVNCINLSTHPRY
jgi:hypothetical protein